MSKKPFKVSARTARLIGRENVSNADGALIELVKNCYDADSRACIILFDIIFDQLPLTITSSDFLEILENAGDFEKEIQTCYSLSDEGSYGLKPMLEEIQVTSLEDYFKSQNSMFIIDCGEGMSEFVIDKHWMTIGTNNKLTDIFTKSGRVKAGAKGIGRFAMDRLGKTCQMITFPQSEKKSHEWIVNWEDFDQEGATIGEVNADFESFKGKNFKQEILKATNDNRLVAIIAEYDAQFETGTLLHIAQLRDWWSSKELLNLFTSLENLSPPTTAQRFGIYMLKKSDKEKYGKVNNDEFNDYDYRIDAKVYKDKRVTIEINRDEFQYSRVDKDLFKRPQMKITPYDQETFKIGSYTIDTSIDELLPGLGKSDLKEEADRLSEFSFSFYYLKQLAGESDRLRFFYKNFNRQERQDWFRKFGGIKIFRDNFRVRPYGEAGNTAFDWLLLGDRQAKSPAAITKKGAGWRVGPNQVAGVINISRLSNLKFEDKSSREGFQENDTFLLFRNLIIAIIHEFEFDRHTIMREMDLLYREKQEEAEARRLAEEILEAEREAEEAKTNKTSDDNVSGDNGAKKDIPDDSKGSDYKEQRDTFKKAYEVTKSDLNDAEEEVRILSALATTGLIVTSFAHEFSSFRWKLEAHTNTLEAELEKLLNRDDIFKTVKSKNNPFIYIEKLRTSHSGIRQWLDIALAAVRKDKRSIEEININQYLEEFASAWEVVLSTRKVELSISTHTPEELNLNAFTIDIDSVFHNLLVNSFDAFDVTGFVGKRKIHIALDIFYSEDEEKDLLEITYSDTGPGLDKKIKNPYLILRRGYTTKVDMDGNENGTGLGMWLINDAVQYYGGTIEIMQPESGFELKIRMPFNNKITNE